MKKFLAVLAASFFCCCMTAQNIKSVEAVPGEYLYDGVMDDEWRNVDSLIVTGTLDEANFRKILDMAEFFNLTGLNLENCRFVDDAMPAMQTILANSAAPSANQVVRKGWCPYDFIYTDERFGSINLKYITFPKVLERVGEFWSCNLVALDIPQGISKVYGWRICHPRYLKEFKVHAMSPDEMSSFYFLEVPESAILYVPKGARDAFANNEVWGNAFKIIKEYDDVTGIDRVANASAVEGGIYTLQGVYAGNDLSELPSGIYIVNGKKIKK